MLVVPSALGAGPTVDPDSISGTYSYDSRATTTTALTNTHTGASRGYGNDTNPSQPRSLTKSPRLAAKALPAPRQIDAAWGAGVYRHGGLMSSIEHINYRHAFGSGFKNVSRFSEGTSVRQIKQYVDDALRYGDVSGGTINYNVGRVIGMDAAGNPVTGIRVQVRDGIIRTAFPVAP